MSTRRAVLDVKRRMTQKLMYSGAEGPGLFADDMQYVDDRKADIENLMQMLTRLATAIKRLR